AIFDPLQRPQKGRTELDLPIGTRSAVAAQAERDQLRHAAVRSRLAAFAYPPTFWGQVLFLSDPRQPTAENGAKLRRLQASRPDLPRGYFLHEPSSAPPHTHLLLRGQASRPGPEVGPGMPAVLVAAQPSFPPPGPRTSQRRLTLARWLTTADHP